MEYKVPFFCAGNNMQNKRVSLGYYIDNLMTADKFDIESAMPVIMDFVKKDKDILETSVDKIVCFLGKVGSKQLRAPTDTVKKPTEWFCKRLADLLKAIKPTDYFLKRLGYAYVKADICHEWIQAFFDYRGPHKKALIEGMADATIDRLNEGSDYLEVYSHIYCKITRPESLPAPLYNALIKSRRTFRVTNWYAFTKHNLSFGRNEKENRAWLRFLISAMIKRVDKDKNVSAEERLSAIEGLKLLKDTYESLFLVKKVMNKIIKSEQRGEYLTYRSLVSEKDFAKYSKSIHKKVRPEISNFVKAYEHPGNELVFKRLSWKEKVMLYDRFDKKTKKAIRDRCSELFEEYLSMINYKKELYYVFKILANNREFLKKYLYDRRLIEKTFSSSKLRTLYLEKLHEENDKTLMPSELSISNSFYDLELKTAVIYLPSNLENTKYRSLVITIVDKSKNLICEVITKNKNEKYSTYSAVKFDGKNTPKSVYPNINKRLATLFVQRVFEAWRKNVYLAAVSFFELKLV